MAMSQDGGTRMDMLPPRLLDRPAQEGARWLALSRLEDLVDARQRLDDPDDTAALHDFRVALRRLRSLLRTYREVVDESVTRRTHRRLRRLASAAGLSRDSEVRLNWLRTHLKAGARDTAGAEWVEGRLDRDRLRAARQFQRRVERRFAPTVEELRRTLRHFRVTITLGEEAVLPPTRDVMAAALHGLATAVHDAQEAARTALGPESMHRVRISAKRLRYALEPLVEDRLAPAGVQATARAAIAQLKPMQDAFGEMHDEFAFGQWVTGCHPDEIATHRAAAAYVERLRHRLDRRVERRCGTLNGPSWQHRIDRIVQRAHEIAERLARPRRRPE